MIVLGLETSCDETGLALYDSELGLRGQVLYSQIKLHAEYGGVVPELASRDHVRKLIPLMNQLLEQSGVKVYCTRTTDRTVSKKARVRLANKRQADMLVSVHCNASDTRKHFVRGIEVLYSKQIGRAHV